MFMKHRILHVCFVIAMLLGVSLGTHAQAPSAFPYAFPVPNDPTTGTTQFTLTKINSSGNAVIMATTDTNGYAGVCVSNCGKTGTAWVAFAGLVPITMENTATAQHYVQIGSSTGGEGHDTGATTYPTAGGDVIGRIQTGTSSGSAAMVMLSQESSTSSSGVSSVSGDGSLITNSSSTGPVTLTLGSAAQNSVWAGPASGGAGAPSYQTAPTFSGANLTSLPLCSTCAPLASPTFTGTVTTPALSVTGNVTASSVFGNTSGSAGPPSFTANPAIATLTLSGTVTHANLKNGTSGHVWFFTTAPTISSGFGTSPSVVANNGTLAFTINVGTGGTASSGVITLPGASTGWVCFFSDQTTPGANLTKQTANTTTSVSVTNYNTSGTATAWSANDVLIAHCDAF
jgi:hypothetical protein